MGQTQTVFFSFAHFQSVNNAEKTNIFIFLVRSEHPNFFILSKLSIKCNHHCINARNTAARFCSAKSYKQQRDKGQAIILKDWAG